MSNKIKQMKLQLKLFKYQIELLEAFEALKTIKYDNKPMFHIDWILENIFNEKKK